MATNTEVAGISIGITADVTGLSSSLNTATQKVDNWLRTMQKPGKFQVTVDAVKGDSWKTLEADLEALVQRVTQGHSVPINVGLHIEDAQAERTRLEGIIKGNLGNLKVPIDIDYKAKAFVTVDWDWGEGPDGPGAPGGDVGRTTVTRKGGTKSRSRRTATTDDEVVSPEPTSAPADAEPTPAKKTTRRKTSAKVTARPAPKAAQPEPEEEPATGGIAAMPTATPKNRAQKARAERLAENTAAHQEEAANASAKAAREWRDVSKATFMANLRRNIEGTHTPRVNREMLEGATGFQAEYEGRTPTGQVSYVRPSGQRVRVLRSPVRRPWEGTFAGERPTEGHVTESRRADHDDPRRGLADPRSMAWFDPGGGFDPEVRRDSKRLFDEAMAKREEEIFKKLGPVLEAREGETHEEHRARLMRDWTSEGWGFNAGKTVTTSAKALEGIAQGLKLPPEVQALDELRVAGKFGEFFGDEVDPGALALRAAAMSQIRARRVREDEEKKGEPLTDKERKAALSKGTQRASRLRGGNALPDKDRPEEQLYVQLNAMIGQAFAEQYYAEQKLLSEQATAQGAETRHFNEARKAFIRQQGPRPFAEPLDTDPDETIGPDDWDALFKDFLADFKMPRIKARKRGPRGTPASAVPETNLQQQIKEWREEMEQQESFEQFDDPQFDPERFEWLQEKLADIEAGGGLGGSARTTPNSRVTWDPPSDAFNDIFFGWLEEATTKSRAAKNAQKRAGTYKPSGEELKRYYGGSMEEYERWNAPLTPAEETYEQQHMAWEKSLPPEIKALLRRTHDEKFLPSPDEQDIIDAARAGAPTLSGSAPLRIHSGGRRPRANESGPLGYVRSTGAFGRGVYASPDEKVAAYYAASRGGMTMEGELLGLIESGMVDDEDLLDLRFTKRTRQRKPRELMGRTVTPPPSETEEYPRLPESVQAALLKRLQALSDTPYFTEPAFDGPPGLNMHPSRRRALVRAEHEAQRGVADWDFWNEFGSSIHGPINEAFAAAVQDEGYKGLRARKQNDDDEVVVFDPAAILRGSARRSRTGLEGLGAAPVEVPDVRDIAEAMGMGRVGFSTSGMRTKITAGSRSKMARIAKGAEVEKVFALIGDRYIDEAGRVLNDIREVIELETDPSKTSKYGFAVRPQELERLRGLTGGSRGGLMGIAHSHPGTGLKLSDETTAAVPGQDDVSTLQALNAAIPGAISGVIDPSTKELLRLYTAGDEGPVRRAYQVKRNIPRMVPEPTLAQAASPVALDDIAGMFNQLPDDAKRQLVEELASGGVPLPAPIQQWANAQAAPEQMVQASMFDPDSLAGGGLGPSPFRWGMGAAGVGVATPMGAAPPPIMGGFTPPPPPGPAAAAAAMGGGFFGGGGAPGGPGGPGAPGGGAAPGVSGPHPEKYQRTTRDIREKALQAGIPFRTLQGLESTYETDYIKVIQEADQIAGQIQEDIGKTPVRAFTTAIGQYASQLFVRGEVGERRIAAQTLGRMFRSSGQERAEAGIQRDFLKKQLEQDLASGLVLPGSDEEAAAQKGIQFQQERFDAAEKAVDFFGKEYAEAAKGVAPLGVQMANLVTITGSMMVAGAAFQVGMQAMSFALEGLMQVTNEGIEAATGYNATLKRVQSALAEQAMATGGVRGAVAGGFAAAGMEATPEQRAMLEGQIGAVTATNRFTVQRDMLRSLENLRAAAPGAAEFGMAPGLVRPTGGLFGTVIGAQQSLDEVIGNELERLSPGGLTGMWNAGMERAPFTGNPFEGTFELFGLTEAGKQREKAQLDFAANLNRELEQVGNTAQFAVGDAFFKSPEVEAQAAALDEIGANEIAAAVRDGAYEIRDANGQIVTEEKNLAQIVKDLGEALQTPSGRETYAAGEKQRRAAMMGIEDQFRNQTNIINPISDWRRLALNRPMAFGTGWNSGDSASQAAQAAFGGGFQDSMASLNRRMAEGRREAINLGVDPADITRLEQYGDQIRGINADLANRRLEVSTQAYNQQLLVARRNLADIRGLTGQIGSETTAVGRAQRENLMLQRENVEIGRRMQERQMDLTQGQINYNLAVSKFMGGGASGAEAYAKQEQARIEAEFAQANLNDQREMFGNEGIINTNTIMVVDEQNLRALQEAVFAVEQLDRERELEKYSAAAEQFLGVLTAEAEILAGEIDAQIARGMGYVNLAQEEIRRVYTETGEVLIGVQEDIADAFKQIREDYDKWLGDLTQLEDRPLRRGGGGARSGSGGGSSDGGGGASGSFATGGLFNTSGEYHMTVGEAGTETVAVLRNPRQMTFNSGSTGVTININNPVVRDETDIQAIARAVEDVLNQRTVLLGLNR